MLPYVSADRVPLAVPSQGRAQCRLRHAAGYREALLVGPVADFNLAHGQAMPRASLSGCTHVNNLYQPSLSKYQHLAKVWSVTGLYRSSSTTGPGPAPRL